MYCSVKQVLDFGINVPCKVLSIDGTTIRCNVYIYLHINININIYIYVHIDTQGNISSHVCTFTHTYIYIHMHIDTYIHITYMGMEQRTSTSYTTTGWGKGTRLFEDMTVEVRLLEDWANGSSYPCPIGVCSYSFLKMKHFCQLQGVENNMEVPVSCGKPVNGRESLSNSFYVG